MSLTVAGNIQKDIAVAVFISDNQSLIKESCKLLVRYCGVRQVIATEVNDQQSQDHYRGGHKNYMECTATLKKFNLFQLKIGTIKHFV